MELATSMVQHNSSPLPAGVEEGEAPVPGGMLRYRVCGRGADKPWLVFENGWGASFSHLYFIEQALAPHARLLFYDRAGIGGSRRSLSQSAPLLTAQFLALLEQVRVDGPVVLAGQSYGGLMAALHAAQAPEAISTIVQIDPTPEIPDAAIDRNLRLVLPVSWIMKLCARLGLPDVFFGAGSELPPEVVRHVSKSSFGSVRSINAALDEFHLLGDIRRAIARPGAAARHPRLVISAARTAPHKSRLQRLLVSDARAEGMLATMQLVHRRQAALHAASRWEKLPHDHGGLVMSAAGAEDVARSILRVLERPAA